MSALPSQLGLFGLTLREVVAPHDDPPKAKRDRVKGMVRHGGHETSIDAADRILRGDLSKLHRAILAAFRADDPVGYNDSELEDCAQFKGYSPSTVRKRRHELTLGVLPYLKDSGVRRPNVKRKGSLIVWELTERGRTVDP